MLVGTASVEALASGASTMDGFTARPVCMSDVEVLQATFEMDVTSREQILPPALHPTNPPMLVVLVWRCPTSPWGPFSLAQVRVGCRSGVRPRALVVGCVVNTSPAASALASGYGFPTKLGSVDLHRRYDGTDVSVTLDGRRILELSAIDPDPLGVGDVQYTVTMNLARTPRGLRLVQVEPEYACSRVERMRPALRQFLADGWGQPLLAPTAPIAVTVAVATVTIPELRFVCRPDVLAFEGSESVR